MTKKEFLRAWRDLTFYYLWIANTIKILLMQQKTFFALQCVLQKKLQNLRFATLLKASREKSPYKVKTCFLAFTATPLRSSFQVNMAKARQMLFKLRMKKKASRRSLIIWGTVTGLEESLRFQKKSKDATPRCELTLLMHDAWAQWLPWWISYEINNLNPHVIPQSQHHPNFYCSVNAHYAFSPLLIVYMIIAFTCSEWAD